MRAIALIPEKSRLLAQHLAALWPAANTDIEFRWAGTSDTTSDGLPLIGDLIAGSTSSLLRDFALDRDVDTIRA